MDEQSTWITNQQQVKEIALNFYFDLFTSDPTAGGEFVMGFFPIISNEKLVHECTDEEVTKALKDMSPFKAPWPDDFQAAFFQRTWVMTRPSITSITKQIMQGASYLSD